MGFIDHLYFSLMSQATDCVHCRYSTSTSLLLQIVEQSHAVWFACSSINIFDAIFHHLEWQSAAQSVCNVCHLQCNINLLELVHSILYSSSMCDMDCLSCLIQHSDICLKDSWQAASIDFHCYVIVQEVQGVQNLFLLLVHHLLVRDAARTLAIRS